MNEKWAMTSLERQSAFLEEYCKIPPSCYLAGTSLIRPSDIPKIVSFLIEEKVFEDKEDMKWEALEQWGVILPDSCFSEAQ